jgi:hypothetical protein
VRSQEHLSTAHHCLGSDKKPIEIYFFIDPVCPECWTIEPILKKLQIEYGRYFSIKHVLSGKITDLNLWKIKTCADKGKLFEKPVKRTRSCYEDKISFNLISSPFIVSIAIKAAELQGRKGGIRFLRKFQEILFLQQQNVTHFDVLIEYIEKSIQELEKRIDALLQSYLEEKELLLSIPGVKDHTVACIIAEIGTDMSQFPTSRHLASWAGVSPGNNESAGKKKAVKVSKEIPISKQHFVK